MADKAFYRVRDQFSVVLEKVETAVEGVFKRVEHEAGAILHLTDAEASDHAHKIEALTDDEAAAAAAADAALSA